MDDRSMDRTSTKERIMLKIYAGNLPSDATEKEITELFSAHGRVRSIKKFSNLRKIVAIFVEIGFSLQEGAMRFHQ